MNFWQFKFNSEYWTNWENIQLGEIEEWQSPKTINKEPNNISINDIVFIYRGSTKVRRGIYFVAKVLNVDFTDKYPIKLKIVKDLRENIFVPENFGFEKVVKKINDLNQNGTYYKFSQNENPKGMYDLIINNKKSIKGVRKKYTKEELTKLANEVFKIYIDKYNKNENLQYSIVQPSNNKKIIHTTASKIPMSNGTAENYSERLFNLWNKLNNFDIHNGLEDCPKLLEEVGIEVFDKKYFLKENILNLITVEKVLEEELKKSKKDTKENRLNRLNDKDKKPPKIEVVSTQYKRNSDVIIEVLERANGTCEKCKNPAPFIRKKDKTPYLEVHHIIRLADNGNDTVENAIAVCPNCHRELHYA
ncbi:HNH endonuclease [Arcobacter sp.]|uniref:HNH endonuclease n=1 Tax=Arcobacter sp. TaxID=1872629 RepID=UPI003C72B30A